MSFYVVRFQDAADGGCSPTAKRSYSKNWLDAQHVHNEAPCARDVLQEAMVSFMGLGCQWLRRGSRTN